MMRPFLWFRSFNRLVSKNVRSNLANAVHFFSELGILAAMNK